MIVLGLILLVLGALGCVAVYSGTRGATVTIPLDINGFTRDVSALELAIATAAAVLLLALGWAAVAHSVRRRSRRRREDREQEHVAELERAASDQRATHERQLRDAGARNEDLEQREATLSTRASELETRTSELEARDSELTRREAEWRDRQGPSVADVVTGRAEGRVADGSAHWKQGGTDGAAEHDADS